MLPRKNRLNSAEIKDIFDSESETSNSPLFFVKKRPNNVGFYRFAVIVPKKVYKTSVGRHFAKRKIMNFLKKDSIPYPIPHKDFVISLKMEIKDISKDQIIENLLKVLN